ncbi:hypothetical protein P9873_21035, partial [Bacillus siamensis]|uniref:hypothetical protein n=1 Tax=Bacillus siamensis TaxID=659243 RepID=UPI002E223A73|nr:hypothetical protein [Bacillus siamensis]
RYSPAGAASKPTAADLLQQPGRPVACPGHKKAGAWPVPESGYPHSFNEPRRVHRRGATGTLPIAP